MEGGHENRTGQTHQERLDKTRQLLQGCLSLCSMARLFIGSLFLKAQKACPAVAPYGLSITASRLVSDAHHLTQPMDPPFLGACFTPPTAAPGKAQFLLLHKNLCLDYEQCCILLKPQKNWIPGTSDLKLSTYLCLPGVSPCPSRGDEAVFLKHLCR